MEKKEITTAKNIFAEINPVTEWNFSDIEEDLEYRVLRHEEYEYTDEDDLREMIEELLYDKLFEVFKAAIIAADADAEDEDEDKYEEGVNYAAGEWTSLVFEGGEKFATEQEAIDTYVC